MEFDKEKKYKMEFFYNNQRLFFLAENVELVGALIFFKDKYNKQLIFPLDCLRQVTEVVQ
jgi:hypothetical protein